MSHKTPLIFLIAGEASGDQLGADFMRSLKTSQTVRFAGIGGEAMETQGLQSLFPMKELSLIGFSAIFHNLPNLLRRLRFTVQEIQRLKPDVVVTIDAPEFSFRVMKKLHKLPQRPRLIHYVAPTVWAWRPGRAKAVSQFLDHLLCLYPFEPPYFEKYGLKSTFVGHPVAQIPFKKTKRDPNLLCVLPGSRASEVKALLPIFGQTVALLQKDFPQLKIVIPTVPAVEELVREGVREWAPDVQIVLGDEARHKAFQNAYVALAASGTVALQLSASRLPFVIAYKVGKINELVARVLTKIRWACMVNILLGREAIPEFLQQNCTPEKLAIGIKQLMENTETRTSQEEAMKQAIELLKAPPEPLVMLNSLSS
jgi:lipid-A-disaccharide synthase